MERPFVSKEQEHVLRASPRAQIGVVSDEHINNSTNMAELMNFDAYAGWCTTSPSTTDPMLAYSVGCSPIQSLSNSYAPFDSFNFTEQNPLEFSMPVADMLYNKYPTNSLIEPPMDFDCEINDSDAMKDNMIDKRDSFIPRSLSQSLPERMLKALSLFKETSGGAILAQVWVPIKHGDQYLLSTCDQPYLLDQMLAGYREVSRTFMFSAEIKPGSFPGLPGRVYMSKVPEWTSNVGYYKKPEYLRLQHAAAHEVRGSIAFPVFEDSSRGRSCCAVLELVTMREKPNFDIEIENVCRALQAVNLRSTAPPRLSPQSLSMNQRVVLAEITDVLRAVCHAHTLPLALTWIPCCYNEEVGEENKRVSVRGGQASLREKRVLCVEDTACYVNDADTDGFVHACTEHYLEEGQGVAGKALKSNHPFFFPDVKAYDILEYPLVHHARKYCLNAAVAIRLRSTYTGDDDYILELFLPINMKGSAEQQLLLDNLSGTMQRICKSLRTVSEAELIGGETSTFNFRTASPSNVHSVPFCKDETRPSRVLNSDTEHMIPDLCNTAPRGSKPVGSHNKMTPTRRSAEKKRSTAERHVSLSVLQQYFSGSLKDAAKHIGVCPTTLKRICRQHGISRWPSRKINKVNRSLQKIQTVLDSVEGVEGGLKIDPISGGIVSAVGVGGNTIGKDPVVGKGSSEDQFPSKSSSFTYTANTDSKSAKLFYPSYPCDPGQSSSVKLEYVSYTAQHNDSKLFQFGQIKSENSESRFISVSASSIHVASDEDEEMDDKVEPSNNHPTSSGMTDSSKESGNSMIHGNHSSSSRSPSGKISVKATYKEDTIRFKFEPNEGCHRIYEEVAKRFNLQIGTFQLKYMDDEEEWVMLVSDSDLHECIEILDFCGTRCVKFLVRDVPFSMGSSGSSNGFLVGGS